MEIKIIKPFLRITTRKGIGELSYDGQIGEFTREEWRDELEFRNLYTDDETEQILNTLETVSNESFFA
jgi:hypothetical protein